MQRALAIKPLQLPTPSPSDPLQMISDAFERRRTAIDLFNGDPTTHAIDQMNLMGRLKEMELAGYTIGTATKSRIQPKLNYCAWDLPITTPDAHCTVVFYVPDDVC
jgi:hypothetical protein